MRQPAPWRCTRSSVASVAWVSFRRHQRVTVSVPFFITGMGRSGSTYLYHLLRAHPLVAITNEAHIIDALWRAYEMVAIPYGASIPDTGLEGLVDPSTKPDLENAFLGHMPAILEEYYRRRFGNRFTHFGDKLPDHCAVGMAAKWASGVRVLVMVRDPRDVVCSYLAVRHRAAEGGPRERKLMAYSVRDFALIWRDTYAYLGREIPGAYRVAYARLVRDPAGTARNVLEYLGLPWDPAVAAEIAANATLATHGSSRTAEDSIGRFRRDLAPADVRIVEDVCAAGMRDLGIPA